MSEQTKCQWCGLIHEAKCPSVKSFEYHPDGTIKRVEFFAPNDYGPKMGDSQWWPARPMEPYAGLRPELQPAYFGAWHPHISAAIGSGNPQ